jgi:hypothetical protein
LNPNTQGTRRFRRNEWGRLPGVVRTIGDEHNGAGLDREVFELIETESERGTDGCSIGQHADIHLLQHLPKQRQVWCEWSLQEGAAGKEYEANKVALPSLDELGDHPAGDRETIARLEVSCLHAARNVQGEHDVAGTKPDLSHIPGGLRSREGEDQQGGAEDSERSQRWLKSFSQVWLQVLQKLE